MPLTATEFRSRLYEVLRTIEQTGDAVEIELRNTRFVIRRAEPVSRLARMQPQRDAIVGPPDELADLSLWDEAAWRKNWQDAPKKSE